MSEVLTPTRIQHEDADAMLQYQHAYVWSKPGTGKTLTSLLAAKKAGVVKGVVVGPTLSVGMWQEEIQTQLGQTAAAVRTGLRSYNKERRALLMERQWITTTFKLASNPAMKALLIEFLKSDPNSVLIIDEAHYCKTKDAARTVALLGSGTKIEPRPIRGMPPMPQGIQNYSLGIGHAAASVWQLTGTPQTRWPDDLWSQLAFGRKEVLAHFGVSSYDQFVRAFCVRSQMNIKTKWGKRTVERITGPKNTTRLRALLDSCGVIQRTLAEAAAELPPITHRRIPVVVSVKDGDASELAERQGALLAELSNPDSPYAKLYRTIGMAKVQAALDYIAEVDQKQALIGVWHRDVADKMYKTLKEQGESVAFVHGGTAPELRDGIRDNFNAGKLRYIVGQMAAMNTSWNLQKSGNYVLIVEQLPSPGMLEQFYQRVYRKGQQQPVQVDHLHAEHWLDDAIALIRASKNRNLTELGI